LLKSVFLASSPTRSRTMAPSTVMVSPAYRLGA
jgi:hypothetical protein